MTLPRGIRKRGNSFIVDITHKGKRLTATTHSLEEAKAKRADLQFMLIHGKVPGISPRRVWTLGVALDYCNKMVWAPTKPGRSPHGFGEAAVYFFGRSRPLNTIDTEAIDHWLLEMERRGNSDATINRNLGALSGMLNAAYDRNRLEKKPKIPYRRAYKSRMRFLSIEEERTLIGLLRQWALNDAADGFVVLTDTGLRIGEMLNLTEKDIDLDRQLIHAWQTKTKNPRTVLMTSRVRKIIRDRWAEMPDKRLFPQSYSYFMIAWNRVRSVMGLVDDPQFVIHILRHTCASRLVQGGVSLALIKEWMGHKHIRSTMVYAHLCPKNFDEAKNVLEAAAPKAPKLQTMLRELEKLQTVLHEPDLSCR